MKSYSAPCESDFTPKLIAEVKERIKLRTAISASGCWEWTQKLKNNYAYFGIRKLRWYAHRWAYRAWNGPISGGLQVCHKCDNPRCCNPDHLFLGTHTDNALDAKSKGRLSSGEKHSEIIRGRVRVLTAKLDARMATAIRRLSECDIPSGTLAAAFGVKRETINNIIGNRTWKDEQ